MVLDLSKVTTVDIDEEDEEKKSLLDLTLVQDVEIPAAQPPELGQPLNLSAAPQEVSLDEPIEVQPPPITIAQDQDSLEESLEGNLTLGQALKFDPFRDLGFETDESGKPGPVRHRA